MIPDSLQLFSKPQTVRRWLTACGISNLERGLANVETITRLNWTESEIIRFIVELKKALSKVADPDQALNNLDRLLSASETISQDVRTLSALATHFEGLSLIHISEPTRPY